jgi:hypothetical protein
MAHRAQEQVGKTISGKFIAAERNRLIGIEVRLSKIGFAVFESSAKLLDWGTVRFGENEGRLKGTVAKRIQALLVLHNPNVVVVRSRNYSSAAADGKFSAILRVIRAVAKQHSAKVMILTSWQVQQQFGSHGRTTKFEIAAKLAREIEGLSWKLPHHRKPYESEHPAMLIFDAAATGLTFLERSSAPKDMSRRNS